jgi:hypothetical protein
LALKEKVTALYWYKLCEGNLKIRKRTDVTNEELTCQIATGNINGSGVVRDAYRYTSGERKNEFLMLELYGLDYAGIIEDWPSLAVPNPRPSHRVQRARMGEPVPRKSYISRSKTGASYPRKTLHLNSERPTGNSGTRTKNSGKHMTSVNFIIMIIICKTVTTEADVEK